MAELEQLRCQLTEKQQESEAQQSQLNRWQGELAKQEDELVAEQARVTTEREALAVRLLKHEQALAAFAERCESHTSEMHAVEAARADSERNRKTAELELANAKKDHEEEVARLSRIIGEQGKRLEKETAANTTAMEHKLLEQAEKVRQFGASFTKLRLTG